MKMKHKPVLFQKHGRHSPEPSRRAYTRAKRARTADLSVMASRREIAISKDDGGILNGGRLVKLLPEFRKLWPVDERGWYKW